MLSSIPPGHPITPMLTTSTGRRPVRACSTRAAIQPLIHPDCDFSPREWAGDRFVGHLTLAMSDIPAHLFAEILAFVQAAAPVGPPAFLADTIHLVAFASDDWAGRYWESLRWEILHAWRLNEESGVRGQESGV